MHAQPADLPQTLAGPVPGPGPGAGRHPGSGWIRAWLMVLALMVYAMILIGGATRLTDSGLSITEWAPVTGAEG